MARIDRYEDIALADLEVGRAQVRTSGVQKALADLVDSIRILGLLQPIVVCPGSKEGKYEILIGQRRFLAHEILQMEKISAAILDERVSAVEAIVISLSENVVRKGLSTKDKIDACTYLYKHYGGTIKNVHERTGLSHEEVSNYVKYDRLMPELKALVDSGEVHIKTALRAQTAAEIDDSGRINTSVAERLAKEISGMTGANQARVVSEIAKDSTRSMSEVIAAARSGERLTEVRVFLGPIVHRGLRAFADEEETGQEEAAATLIEEGLSEKGLIDE